MICVTLFLLALAVFWPATRNDFVNYDDPRYVLSNTHVQGGPTFANVGWALTTGYAANWHPLTWLSHMVDCRLFGLKPSGHHATSVVLHATNIVLAYLALCQLTQSTWRSLAVALLFGLHPLRVESVAWIAERKDVLSTFFWLATLWAYALWVRRSAVRRAGAGWFYVLALVCFGFGLMSKPMLVTLPCVLLLLDFWPLRRLPVAEGMEADYPGSGPRSSGPQHTPLRVAAMWRRLVWEKLPFFALAIVACIVTYAVQRTGGAVMGTATFAPALRVGNALLAYAQYVGKFIYPVQLAVYYPHPGATLSWSAVVLCAALLLGFTILACWQYRARPWLTVGWLWFLGTLVPVIGLVQVGTQAMADRYTYVPMLGLTIALVWTAHEFAARWRVPSAGMFACLAASVAACVVLTRAQVGYWRDSESLFRHAAAVTIRNDLAHIMLGIAMFEKGAKAEGITEVQTALEISPHVAIAHLNLGAMLDSVGRSEEAIEHFRQAIRQDPRMTEAHFCLGEGFNRQRRFPDAITEYQETVRLEPDHADARLRLGAILYDLDRYDEALAQLREFLRLRPRSAEAYANLGNVFLAQGRFDEALPYYEQALRIQPDHADTLRNMQMLRAAKAAAGR